MPELPEVETTRKGISPFLVDKVICRVLIHNASLRWPIPTSIQNLRGHKVLQVSRRGKYLLLGNCIGTALLHLGMSGSLRICAADSERRKHDHAEFFLESGHILRFHDPRRFGCILWEPNEILDHPLLSRLGPEPLEDTFDVKYLSQAIKGRKAAIKNLIMDSHIVVGVGNIYASESLFLAGIRPTKSGARITLKQREKLVAAIKQVLGKAIREGGTTLRDFVNSDGNPGYFAQSLNVYGRKGKPCNNCGEMIKAKTIGQRASYYCSNCQI